MQLGWIDFSKEDRQKAFDVINLLSEQGAVDELGIGVIRDAFANYFFPGTSTIQTRAKYFLIVPYMLREAVDGRYGKDANRVLRAIDSAEKDCGIRLLEADPKAEGVIGSRVLPKGWVARKPSDIYWNGIRTFGIFCDYGLSIPEYVSLAVKLKEQKSVSRLGNRNDDAEENDKDDSDAGDIGNIRFWNLPIYHDDWRDNLTIELTQEEAFYLDKQIQKSTKGSLLEYVLKNRIDLNEYDDFASLTAELSEKVGEKLAYMMKLACDFNNLVYMAKDFQRATVERVDYLFRHNQNRVLVADEVGMGKTLIARGAIVKTARLRIEEKDDLFKVIYICSNQNIANQNIRKLNVTGKNAIGSVSDTRLSMQHLKITEQENDPQIKEGFIQLMQGLRH